jgi:branched-chain amino acid transport system ATP-binding protein
MSANLNVLEVEGLCVSYGRIQAVAEVSLVVPQGAIATIIGTNGAGKTTTLSGIIGLLRAQGKIRIQGQDFSTRGLEARVAAGLCLVPERRELFGSMSVEDNLLLGGHLLANATAVRAELERNFERFPRLGERRGQLAATLSGGERQMLAMGRALMARPKLLMLDEPSLGLAPLIVRDILHIVQELKRDGASILLVEQNARAALRVADIGYVMELGRLKPGRPSADLLADEEMERLYIGKPSNRD